MFYFFYGEDYKKARDEFHKTLDGFFSGNENTHFSKITADNFNEPYVEELIFGRGLFEDKSVVVIDGVFENKDVKEAILKKVKDIKNSENIFVWIEGGVDKTTIKKIEKNAEKITGFEQKQDRTKKQTFNMFRITDSFGERNKKSTWILFQKALLSGASPEEIHGIIFWQVKSMLLASDSNLSMKDTKLNPFVYKKASMYSKNFNSKELKNLSHSLVQINYDSRMGVQDFEIALERFILSI